MSDSLKDILSQAASKQVSGTYNHIQLNYIEKFIKDNDIKEGHDTVHVRFIYALYCDQTRPPIKRNRFSHYFSKFFKKHVTGNLNYYRLDKSTIPMPSGWTIWKEKTALQFKYKKTKYKNIKSTPNGWMIYLDLSDGRHIYEFERKEKKAAEKADHLAWYYFGPEYKYFNFKGRVKDFKEDSELLSLLTQGNSNDKPKKT